MAPEYATTGQLSEKVDTYSFGIVALEIISGRICTDQNFSGPDTAHLLEHVTYDRLTSFFFFFFMTHKLLQMCDNSLLVDRHGSCMKNACT